MLFYLNSLLLIIHLEDYQNRVIYLIITQNLLLCHPTVDIADLINYLVIYLLYMNCINYIVNYNCILFSFYYHI